ncbi:uncharacterized protein Y057_4207 [Fusarium fujikuroi]|nr:uncharacterized protein Y057_4207 [Fusarium fujikuroi]
MFKSPQTIKIKASIILALPAIAAAAATPQVKERQVPTVFDPECLLQITGISVCLPNLDVNSVVGIDEVALCPVRLLARILRCINVDGVTK